MRVGLVRHFPVEEPMPSGWMTARQLHEWRIRYDGAAARPLPVSIEGNGWQRCYSSDLSRAYVTARAMYAGEIMQTPLLREPDVAEFQTGSLTLPWQAWRWVLRLAWLSGHSSQRKARDDFQSRVKSVAELIESSAVDTLIFSHAGMMAYLRRELVRRGFTGPKFTIADHARLYVFEREAKGAGRMGGSWT